MTKTNKATICPMIISNKTENKIKLKFTDNKSNSKYNNTITKFRRLQTIPQRPEPNTAKVNPI